ncbi:VOC family protein [Tsukamurella ocularis]|uniref:VOC family protein n=1 Tax=Tsukamurella ocularis TaxID=1970234 RepID=UPI002168DB8C|nr:VOC family protein [Tsukamurella ocularis]MCS3780760.1 catechol 2,3-dioxygenase-like lactoylglutathione lyase family enzyme [Tsukamurella ocularis]MCS3786584.1 catechol 2,3-dioxygenase-like lactoylglutathione lyase family enzyme [Tsukamurella ocularis]MCS3850426.1 catechol 2,3-dioxygenase-like lactoylglutathione lyase family enzyme [Tsukamurella ocularis]
MDLFARLAVTDLPRAIAWGEQLFGDVESFAPNDVEHVWMLGEHAYVYAELLPERAGHAAVTLFLDDVEAFLAAAAGRGLRPDSEESYDNGVRKAIFVDPDGNEVGIGGAPA